MPKAEWKITRTRPMGSSLFYEVETQRAVHAYCLKCSETITMVNPTATKIGRTFGYLGICPDCGAKVSRIAGKGTT